MSFPIIPYAPTRHCHLQRTPAAASAARHW